jgi:nucleoside-diphosphate-sugar epimerase
MKRDFTYIDDVVEAVVRLIERPAVADAAWSGTTPNPATSVAPWHVYNIGNHTPVEVNELVRLIEEANRPHGHPRTRADAAGRHAGNLRGRGGPSGCRRLCARTRRSAKAVRRFVQWVSRLCWLPIWAVSAVSPSRIS